MVTVIVSLYIAVLFRIHARLSLKMKNIGLDVVTISTVGFSVTILNLKIWNRKLAGKCGRTIMDE